MQPSDQRARRSTSEGSSGSQTCVPLRTGEEKPASQCYSDDGVLKLKRLCVSCSGSPGDGCQGAPGADAREHLRQRRRSESAAGTHYCPSSYRTRPHPLGLSGEPSCCPGVGAHGPGPLTGARDVTFSGRSPNTGSCFSGAPGEESTRSPAGGGAPRSPKGGGWLPRSPGLTRAGSERVLLGAIGSWARTAVSHTVFQKGKQLRVYRRQVQWNWVGTTDEIHNF